MDNLYTKKRSAQYRGPTTSDDYNSRIEENYKDLLHLTNKVGIAEENIRKSNRYILRNLEALSNALFFSYDQMRDFIADNGARLVPSGDEAFVDNDRFNETSFAIAAVDRCDTSRRYRQTTLPNVSDSSASKLKFEDENGNTFLPSTFEAFTIGDNASVDDASAFVNTTDVADAIVGGIGSVWERNVIVDTVTPGTSKARVSVYIKIPEDVSVVADTNCLIFDPYPMLCTDVEAVMYTTAQNPLLKESDGYVSFNPDELYESNPLAVGKVPPGGFSGDKIGNCPPTRFYFDPKPITAIKVTISQPRFVKEESDSYVFSYGLNHLDVRYDKFLDTGKIMFRVDAKDGETISEAYDVTPLIYNVSLADIPYVFSYRTIWETAVDSGVYTTTPVPFSEKVWIEVTLNKTTGGTTPVLSGLKLN